MDAADPSLDSDEAAEHRYRALALTVVAAIVARWGITADDFPSGAAPQPVPLPPTKPRPAWLRGVAVSGRSG